MEINGCVGLVTGGNRGIGEAFVRVLLESGAQKVYAGSRDPAAAAHLVEQYPGRCVALELDVTDYDEVAKAARECGDVNLVVNNAGLFSNQTLLGAADMSVARQEMELNFFGTLAMCRAFAPSWHATTVAASSTCCRPPRSARFRTWAATDHRKPRLAA